MKKSLTLTALALSSTLWLGACGSDSNHDGSNSDSHDMSHGDMMHSSDGKLPSGLKEASNPTYAKGSSVTLTTNHMDGMDGAKATIAGAYDTVVYAISYKPTDGGKMVKNHKWVIQEELDPVPTKPLQVGDETTVKADHMKGMDGAKAAIDEVKEATVYMVNYEPTDGGEIVKNHKWVTEDEIKK